VVHFAPGGVLQRGRLDARPQPPCGTQHAAVGVSLNKKGKKKMKKLILAGLSTVAMASAANAQPGVPADSLFAGPYAGVQVGIGRLADTHNDLDDWYYNARDARNTDNGVIGGVRVGYDAQFSHFLVGALAEGSIGKLNTNSEYTPEDPSYEIGAKISHLGSIRGKLGLTSGKLAAYGTAGIGFANIKHKYRETDGSGELYDAKGDRSGFVYGAGVAYAVNGKSNVAFDISQYDFGKKTHELFEDDGTGTDYFFTQKNNVRTLTLSYNYRF
jgi:opacity protein-like surface antigen